MKAYKILIAAILLTSCSNEYGKFFDIDYPVPSIKSVTENPMVGDTITILGSGFVAPNTVSVNNISMKVAKEDESGIRAILPRIFTASPLVVKNVYKMQNEETFMITPRYPEMSQIQVLEWPSKVIRGRSIVLKGTNVDLITSVTVGESTTAINGLNQTPDQIVFLAASDLPDHVKIVATTMYGNKLESPLIPVEDPGNIIIPVDPVKIFDFEDGVTHYSAGEMAAGTYTSQINRSGIVPGRGDKSYSFYTDNLPSQWTYLGSLIYEPSTPINLAAFTDPHISFMINSADNVCNFQVAMVQDGKTGGSYFANGVTGNPLDAWMLRPTHGEWQWVTARLKDLLKENWGGDFKSFDPNGKISRIELVLKPVNAGYWDGTTSAGGVFVNKKFRLNLDQVMITDGPVKPIYKLCDFEANKSYFHGAPSNGQTADVNKISTSEAGNHYFTVIKNNSAGWKWLGTLEFEGDYDFSTINDPYMCFLVNTNGEKGNLQFQFFQNGASYGASIDTKNWMFSTSGWQMIKLHLKDMQWDNWSGTSSKIDFGTTFQKLVIGFSSGNVSNMKYEINIDDIYISDGAMF